MLKTILSISGKPGLYKLVSHGKNMLIVESLTDNKRVPAYAKDKVISLGDIAIYTDETEVPLHEVLTSVKNKEEGKAASLVPSKATTDQLRAYFAEVLPSYDRERVYPSDIKKLLSWYNILINAGITDFTPEDAPAEKEAAEKEAEYTKLFANPYNAAKYGYIDDVIEPRNTRFRIIRALQQLQTKKLTNPAKKHGNIPL